jgi:hypothetical protein
MDRASGRHLLVQPPEAARKMHCVSGNSCVICHDWQASIGRQQHVVVAAVVAGGSRWQQ